MKKRCAKEALKFIKDGMVVGLGGGSTISYLCEYVKENNLDIQVVSPSLNTRDKCNELGIELKLLEMTDHVDVAFDGCDEVDYNLNALKSGGGIHTQEKIIGSMADNYILLVDESKVSETLTFKHPVVIECAYAAYHKVMKEVTALGGKVSIRKARNKDGSLNSDQGLMLLDSYFEDVKDIKKLYEDLIHIVGVLEVSLFVNEADKVLIVCEDGFKELTK